MAQFALVSFAMTATYSTQDDNLLIPIANVGASPSSTSAGTPILLVWNTSNITQIELTANNGTDPPLDSGLITTYGAGSFFVPEGFSKTTVITMNAYNALGDLVSTPMTQVTIADGFFGTGFGGEFAS